ncbi:MAG TPA: SHOCT domain-containing protein [Nakamurella sp.]
MSNFWDIIWIVVWTFLFVAYLMIFFRILVDLFGDKELSGWFKAIWIIALIFVPFLTALIYLIARGRGMAERQMAAMQQAQSQQAAYIREVAGGSDGKSSAQHIADAKALLDTGAINQAEFDKLKAKALA